MIENQIFSLKNKLKEKQDEIKVELEKFKVLLRVCYQFL
jgi:hypothetical protein